MRKYLKNKAVVAYMWREYIKPYLQKAVDVCREFKVIPYFHGCGGFTEDTPIANVIAVYETLRGKRFDVWKKP